MENTIKVSWFFGLLSNLFLILEIVLLIFFAWRSKKRAYWLSFFFLSFFFAFILATFLKFAFPYPRPLTVVGLENLYDSFPSRHTLIASSLAFSSFYFYPKLGLINILIAILIGLFRVLGLHHWFWDIFAGFLLGLIVTLLLKEFYLKKESKDKIEK